MAGLHFDSTFNSEPVTKALEKIQKGIYETAKVAELSSGRIDAAFNRISLKGLERIHELMQGFPKEIQSISSFQKQMADLEKRLEQANKKIIELQNQARQPITIQTNTSEIVKETFAYDSLLESLNDILGARGQNISAILQEQNAIRINQKELKVLQELEAKGLKLSNAQQARRVQLTNSIMQHKQAVSSLQQVVSNEIKLKEAAKGSMDEMSQSLGRMRMAYRQLTEEERNSKFGQDLLKNIQGADAQIKQLDATIGNHARNIGDYKQQWNGLQYQMQMVAREMPNFAINPQTGIISLTNNLPYLVDELSKASKAYKDYITAVKAGATDLKAVPSVGKQVLSSLLNWQTALIMGITLITAYRKEITEWVGGLFNAKDAVKELLSAEQEMALARKNAISDSTKERTELDLLYNKLKSTTISTQERNAAISEWIKKYPQHANIMDGELINLGKLGLAYQSLSKQIVESAKARAYADKITELEIKRYDSNFKRLNQQNTLKIAEEEYLKTKEVYDKLQNEYDKGKSVGQSLSVARVPYMNAKEEYERQRKIYDDLDKQTNDYVSKIGHLTEQIKVDDLFPQPQEGTYDYWQQQIQNADIALKQIDSKQRKLLNAGKFDKVDSKVVANYKEQKRLIAEAEKELKAYPSSSDTTKQDKAADTLRQQQEKLALLMNKQALDQARSAEDLQTQVDQARINAMDEGSKKTLGQMELNFEKEMQAIDRQKEDLLRKKVEDERVKFDKKEDENAAKDPKYKKQTFNPTGIVLSDGENKQFDELYKSQIESFEKDKQKQELEAMRDYLKEYGTFQQQKLAIAEEYADKIKNAQNKGEILKLEKERDVAIQNKETEAIKANIDWVTVFGEFGGMFNDMIKPALEEAKKYVQTDKFKNSDQASQKSLIDAINQMEKSLGGAGGVNFKKLGQDVQVYQNALRSLSTAKEEEIEAINKLKKANKDYEKAVNDGTEQEKQVAKDALDMAQQNADTASANVKTQTDIANQSQQDVTNTATGLRASMVNVTEGLNKLASGGIKNAYDGLIQAGKGIGGSMEKITKSLDSVPIIGWILSIIDVFKDGLSNFVGPLLDSIFNAISGILSDVLSGDFFVTIGKSLASGVGNILNAITFGGFNSWFNIGGNAKETAEIIDKLTNSNEALKTSIDGLTKKMDESNGIKSIEYYEKAKEAQGRSNENYRQILDAQMGYNSAHHSNAYYWDLDRSSMNQVNKLLGTNLKNSWEDFSKLTAEQMNEIRIQLPNVWSEMIDQGKYGDRFKDDWNNYADQAGKVEELTKKINENIAQISFDSLRDSFVDTLMDMDANAEDFANNFEEYLMRSMLNFSIGDMDDEIEAWYTKWAETIRSQKGELTPDQIKQYKKEWDDFVQRGIDKRNGLAELTGYDGSSSSSQSSTKKGFEAMSQDSSDELNGRFTALQISNEEIKNSMLSMLTGVNVITTTTAANGITLTEIRNIALMSNSHLEDIAKYTKELIGFRQIIGNIENSAKVMAGK